MTQGTVPCYHIETSAWDQIVDGELSWSSESCRTSGLEAIAEEYCLRFAMKDQLDVETRWTYANRFLGDRDQSMVVIVRTNSILHEKCSSREIFRGIDVLTREFVQDHERTIRRLKCFGDGFCQEMKGGRGTTIDHTSCVSTKRKYLSIGS